MEALEPRQLLSAASFIGTDISSSGTWQRNFGGDGYDISQGPVSAPSYASVSVTGQSNFTWAQNSGDIRALAVPGGGDLAGTWYSSTNFTVNVNITDGNTHEVSFYFLDWDSRGRGVQVQVEDANSNAVLNTQNVSGFSNGTYLSWNLSGNVKLVITDTAGPNAVLSGVFFGPSISTFLGSDSSTKGNWQQSYGGDGYDISQAAVSLPSYASVALTGQSNYTWSTSASDARNLLLPGGGAIAGTWYSGSSFTVDLNITDHASHQVSFYVLDWDGRGRVDQIQMIDTNTNLVMNTQLVFNFSGGEYFNWNISGHVKLVFNSEGNANSVLSGIFFGQSAATFIGTNTTLQGNWNGTGMFGNDGYDVSQGSVSLPSYATATLSGQSNYTWASNNGDPRNLNLTTFGTVAGTWYSATTFSLDINITDGNAHKVSFYFLDWDRRGRQEQVQITNQTTGLALNTQTVSNFGNGTYLSWNLEGHVRLVFTNVAGPNVVMSGIFFN